MRRPGPLQRKSATERAATLRAQHGDNALSIANAALIGAVRAGDDEESNLLCEACLILLRTRSAPPATRPQHRDGQ